jgi:hypothetical protein
MWFYPILLMLLVLGLAGGIFLGGVYTLVLMPLVVIALVSVLGYAMWARSQSAAGTGAESGPSPGRPLPHRRRREPAHVTAPPERLVDARRQQQ